MHFLIFLSSVCVLFFFFILNLHFITKRCHSPGISPASHLLMVGTQELHHQHMALGGGVGWGLVPGRRALALTAHAQHTWHHPALNHIIQTPGGHHTAPSREGAKNAHPLSLCQSHAVPLGATSRPGWGPGGLDVPSLLGQL